MTKLAEILADMVRTAVAWEQDYGQVSPCPPPDGLNSTATTHRILSSEITPGGENNDNDANGKTKQ